MLFQAVLSIQSCYGDRQGRDPASVKQTPGEVVRCTPVERWTRSPTVICSRTEESRHALRVGRESFF